MPTTTRIPWIDHAKGLCILAVVTLYATREVQAILQAEGWMQRLVDFAQPFRMPDFFLVAGLLVPRIIDRPWRSYIDTKVLYFAYFYALWASIGFVFQNRAAIGPSGDALALLSDYLRLFHAGPPYGPLWFIYILALFFLAVRLLRVLPALPVLAAAAALQVWQPETGLRLADKFAQYFVFFYAGQVFSAHVFRLAAWARRRTGASAALLLYWFAVNALLVDLGWAMLPGISLLAGLTGALAITLLSTLLARVSWMDWLRYLGRHSIVIYLGFLIPLRFTRGLVADPVLAADAGSLSLLVTFLSVAGAMILYEAARRTPLRFLFERPAWASLTGLRGAAVLR